MRIVTVIPITRGAWQDASLQHSDGYWGFYFMEFMFNWSLLPPNCYGKLIMEVEDSEQSSGSIRMSCQYEPAFWVPIEGSEFHTERKLGTIWQFHETGWFRLPNDVRPVCVWLEGKPDEGKTLRIALATFVIAQDVSVEQIVEAANRTISARVAGPEHIERSFGFEPTQETEKRIGEIPISVMETDLSKLSEPRQQRSHEVWDDPGHVELLTRVWGPPTQPHGRHSEALRSVAELIRYPIVLDAACGMGHLFRKLMTIMPEADYLGFDNSDDQLVEAHKAFPNEKHRFEYGDVFNITQDARDTVVAVDLLMHMPDLVVPIQQMWNKAKRELIFTAQVANRASMSKTPHSGPVQLSEGKELINRYDTLQDYFQIFSTLEDLGSVEIFYFDERSTMFRLSKGKKRWQNYVWK